MLVLLELFPTFAPVFFNQSKIVAIVKNWKFLLVKRPVRALSHGVLFPEGRSPSGDWILWDWSLGQDKISGYCF